MNTNAQIEVNVKHKAIMNKQKANLENQITITNNLHERNNE